MKTRYSICSLATGALVVCGMTDTAVADDTGSSLAELEQVLVTAQKRGDERLQDVPVPITALSAQQLAEKGALRLQDYYSDVPGMSVTPTYVIGGQPSLSMRSISTDPYTSPTVGVVVGSIPLGASTLDGGGYLIPDFDPSELERIEVLRGPQGTLYGASSMGGLLKFVPTDPSTSGYSGRVQAGSNSVRNGEGLGFNVRASANIPLSDTFAMRASGFTRRDPGYIDNLQAGIDGVNEIEVHGGRLATLWQASDAVSVKLSAILQTMTADGAPDVDVAPGLGDLEQARLGGTGAGRTQYESYTAEVNANIGEATLTAISGYGVSKLLVKADQPSMSARTNTRFGVTGTHISNDVQSNKFSQELRMTTPLGERFEWIVGAFFTNERTDSTSDMFAIDPTSLDSVGQWSHLETPNRYRELAAFTDLTVKFTERFDVQVGGRQSQVKQKYRSMRTGPYVTVVLNRPDPLVVPEVNTDEDVFTYLVTPRFKLSPDTMLYARLASGYRPGDTNAFPTGLNGLPGQSSSDRTLNYEIGFKGDFLDRRLSIDTSAYLIDWKDIQLQLFSSAINGYYSDNGGRARSRGVEFAAEARPVDGMTIGGWVAFSDAVLTENFPTTASVRGIDGDRLPNSSRWSGKLSVAQEFPLTGSVSGFAGGAASYFGERVGSFLGGTTPRSKLPSYSQIDLRLGVRYDTWVADVFVNNVGDKRGLLRGGLGSFPANAYVYTQPRTIGMNVSKSF